MGVRTLARGTFSWRAGLLAGVLLGLANLTRTWALGALGAVLIGFALAALRRRDHDTIATLVAAAAAAVVLMTPWLVAKTVLHGSPLAYSRPVPSQWLSTVGRCASGCRRRRSRSCGSRTTRASRTGCFPSSTPTGGATTGAPTASPNELHNDPPKLPA